MKMKIGFAQFQPILGDPDANIRKIHKLGPAMAEGDIIVLPELANSGYNFSSKQQAFDLSVIPEESEFVDTCISLCSQYDISIVVGINERCGDQLYNSAVLLNESGIIGKYRKQHLFLDEKDIFHTGDLGFPVFEVQDVRVGMLICFDWIFPEAWRILALDGADIICHPSNIVIPGLAQMAVPVRAVENRVFVITTNRIGTEGNLTFTGLSTIANPKGEVVCQADQVSETVMLAEVDIDLARQKMITRRNHVLNDRKPEEYNRLIQLEKPAIEEEKS